MKKILFTLMAFVAMLTAEAKVVKITMTDGTMKVFTSSELSSIEFNDNGTMTVVTYDGKTVEGMNAEFFELEIDDQEVIYEQHADTLRFSVDADGILVDLNYERAVRKFNYVYPSTDPFGQPISLSGTILIPEEILSGEVASEGIMLFNHYTKFHRDEAPTISNGDLESMFMANPLNPNYIAVESDFYGFGATVRFPQAFVQGTHNARATLDGLLAARRLLNNMGIEYGPLCFNIGYSSGGYDALMTQKLRDMEYADVVSFDKTFAGGSPNDVREAYRQYVQIDSTAYNAVPLLLMVSMKETQKLDIDYADVFQPYICNRIDELVLSKQYSSWPICDSIGREKKVHEILTEPYCNLKSAESKAMQKILAMLNVENDWTPDPTQRLYIFHSRGDDYVPLASARPLLRYLKTKGLEPSIIPGKTNLQTNFVVRNMGHLLGTTVYFAQSLSAIAAWPKMYTDNQLNPEYAAAINHDLNIVEILHMLDDMGIDTRSVILSALGMIAALSGEEIASNPAAIMNIANKIMGKLNFTPQELMEMSEDSGINIVDLFVQLISYLYGQSTHAGAMPATDGLMQTMKTPELPSTAYELQLRDWLERRK